MRKLLPKRALCAAILGLSAAVAAAESLSFGGRREEVSVGANKAFVILPASSSPGVPTPWVWYAPTFVRDERPLPNNDHAWMFEQLLAKGFAIAGVDVGESFGNPAGRAVFTEFFHVATHRFGLSPKACLLPQSRGGLMLYNWAAEHPDEVACIGGIYPVGDQSSWPGLARSSAAYGMSEAELAARLADHNPIDRLAPLAQARIPILHVHGDADAVVPLERNSAELARRYRALGGEIELIVPAGKGHKVGPEFFQEQRLVDFFLKHGKAAAATHIVLAGDSTVTDTAGWGKAFAALLRPGVRCTNLARGGTSTKSFRDQGLWDQVLALKPSHVMIQFGHNDMPTKGEHRATDANTTYRENLARFVDEARAVGAQPILVTSLARRNFKDGEPVDLLADYAAAMRKVATEKNVPLVDLHASSLADVKRMGPEASAELGPIKKGKRDYTHLTEAGARWAARLVADKLRAINSPLAGDLK